MTSNPDELTIQNSTLVFVTTGADGKTLACATYQSPDLKGLGDTPPIMDAYQRVHDLGPHARHVPA
jgi:hypothetical protein